MRERLFELGDFWIATLPGSTSLYRFHYDKQRRQTVRFSLGTADLEAAKLKLAEHVITHAKMREESPQDVPVSVVLLRYQEHHASKLASAEVARHAIKHWIRFWGEATVSELTPSRQREFMADLRGRGLSDGYVRRVITVGKAALGWAFREQELSTAPYIHMPPEGEAFDYRPPDSEIAAFMREARATPHLLTYTLIRLGTLCRGDAALELTAAQVDYSAKLVRLNQAGRKQTKKRRPTVPLPGFLAEHLRTLGRKPEETFVLFEGKPIDSIKTAFNATARRAKCSPQFVPKALRHAGATELRRQGVPGWETSGQLGHTSRDSAGTTEIYATYDPAYLGRARKALEAWYRRLARLERT
jgi:site-specific recombinase XerD